MMDVRLTNEVRTRTSSIQTFLHSVSVTVLGGDHLGQRAGIVMRSRLRVGRLRFVRGRGKVGLGQLTCMIVGPRNLYARLEEI